MKPKPPAHDREATEPIGRVLGSFDATPLELHIGVDEGKHVQLDDLVVIETAGPNGVVRYYGIVDVVRKRYEGASFDGDAFRAAEGLMPVDVSYAAHVQISRIEPEVFIPPHPGDRVSVVRGEALAKALSFDTMDRKIAIGLSRSGEPLFANLEFVDGTRGAHVSISGISGVATKTSYATFLLYSLFNGGALGAEAANTKAIIFNVKGEDLLWLDRPNARVDDRAKEAYRALGLPVGPFKSVGLYAPARRAPNEASAPMPDTGGRVDGVRPYLWTMRAFARDRLLRFAFADAEDARAQVSFVIARVERELEQAARMGDPKDAGIEISGTRIKSFTELVELLDGPTLERMVSSAASGTLDAFRRRLHAAAMHMGHLVRGDGADDFEVDWSQQQITVVDIHRLHSLAQMFVVGVILKRTLEEKEQLGKSKPLVFVVLDELNKYAPRDGWSPIREVLLDIAERGRSLGVALVGAQQTASEVARRVVANASLRVVGRLDSAEAERAEYGHLGKTAKLRAAFLQPGTMIVTQPEIPTPLLLRFPFPAWATRSSEAVSTSDPFARVKR